MEIPPFCTRWCTRGLAILRLCDPLGDRSIDPPVERTGTQPKGDEEMNATTLKHRFFKWIAAGALCATLAAMQAAPARADTVPLGMWLNPEVFSVNFMADHFYTATLKITSI